ncbi:hypothetical protein CEUSTIGMA_g7634.t1 [Chlamydomonas eustigma]|uniref:Nudix hydrolase domain-containing protein n=1 Tax=Chlamydomonas eustigma TaxID=1157962 RepID=A0A250XAX7_9CHLO|nr:hypothetical protein CEUSTIGMA_g7634.t1 [Chlamydomonas eustigma]|eukprot:GAX80196.1 hypothetical protein CEUSTIGMA_g7634.t1 [Chlamydomonas eustigma]
MYNDRHQYFTRSSITGESWKAAGVLPFTFHLGKCWVLLGGESVRTGPKGKFRQLMWRDFGGLREAMDEDAAATASRECSEETLGMLFGSSSADHSAINQSSISLAAQLREGSSSLCVVHQLKKGSYHMFISQSSFVEPLMFSLAMEQNALRAQPIAGAEKISVTWVLMVDLLKVVSKERRSYFYGSKNRLFSGRAPFGYVPQRLTLPPCFVNSLRSALNDGLLAFIKACREASVPETACLLDAIPDQENENAKATYPTDIAHQS